MPVIHRTTDPPPLRQPDDDLPGPLWLLLIFVLTLAAMGLVGARCEGRRPTVELKP